MNVLKARGFILVAAAAFVFPAFLPAQETTFSNLQQYYDAELFQWNFSLTGGLTLSFHNQNVSTIYGVKAPMKDAFLRYTDSANEYKSYKWKNAAGNFLLWGGLAAAAGAVMFLYASRYEDETGAMSNMQPAMGGVVLGGYAATFVGSFLISAGQENIYTAVNLYNRNRIGDFK
jgi:hypothetical protein